MEAGRLLNDSPIFCQTLYLLQIVFTYCFHLIVGEVLWACIALTPLLKYLLDGLEAMIHYNLGLVDWILNYLV